jgi:hypothetical protein
MSLLRVEIASNRRTRQKADPQLRVDIAVRFDLACGGRSHRGVGAELGLPGETVRRYRKGVSSVPLHIASRLCTAFNVSPSWLLLGVEAEAANGLGGVREDADRSPPARARETKRLCAQFQSSKRRLAVPDDLNKRGPGDPTRINVHEPWELERWCKELGVTPERLREVVKKVGVMVKDVRRELGK